MKLLIILTLVLQASAQDFHGDVHMAACSDSDKADMYGLDGEVAYYADFIKMEEAYALPAFADPVSCPECYDAAVGEEEVCRANLQVVREAMKDLPLELDAPSLPLLYPRDHLRPSQPNTLVCQASGFYPAPVHFSWTKDRANISSSSVSQAYPQSDGSFTQFSTLHIQPEDGQVYSCSLDHPALRGQRKTRLWKVQFQKRPLAPSVFCLVGLALGTVGVAVGSFFLVKVAKCQ